MPVDIDARVRANQRLSRYDNVLALDAPEIACRALPGQFVMMKTSRGMDPLLRRPFSIFEILRDDAGAPVGISLLNKRVGRGTAQLHDAEPGMRLSCVGPLGRPFEPIEPPAEAWMVAGGVGLAPFLTLAEALVARGTATTLFYGARRGAELYCLDRFEPLGLRIVVSTEDGSRGAHGYVTVALDAALSARPAAAPVKLFVCGPTPMMRAAAALAARHNRACDVSLEQVMGCGLGGCYSCVVATRDREGPPHHVRTCVDGPVLDAGRIVWEAVAGH